MSINVVDIIFVSITSFTAVPTDSSRMGPSFFPNEEIFIQFHELDELDKITHA